MVLVVDGVYCSSGSSKYSRFLKKFADLTGFNHKFTISKVRRVLWALKKMHHSVVLPFAAWTSAAVVIPVVIEGCAEARSKL